MLSRRRRFLPPHAVAPPPPTTCRASAANRPKPAAPPPPLSLFTAVQNLADCSHASTDHLLIPAADIRHGLLRSIFHTPSCLCRPSRRLKLPVPWSLPVPLVQPTRYLLTTFGPSTPSGTVLDDAVVFHIFPRSQPARF
jgi:hypothetical protein